MPLDFINSNLVRGFALFVDLNGFTKMVAKPKFEDMAQFTHDLLCGAVLVIEANRGEVVSLTGDGFLAILPQETDVFWMCVSLAKDVDKQCEYISNAQTESKGKCWPFCPGGPSLKIGIEFGEFEVAKIQLRYLGEQRLFVGPAINYASRILRGSVGNQCRVGPEAAKLIAKSGFGVGRRTSVKGKKGEPRYTFHRMDLGDVWIEGRRKRNGDSYWG